MPINQGKYQGYHAVSSDFLIYVDLSHGLLISSKSV